MPICSGMQACANSSVKMKRRSTRHSGNWMKWPMICSPKSSRAIDLRFILAVIKINGDLERIGDQSMSIATRTLELIESDPIDLPIQIDTMRNCAARMIRTALQSLLDADAQLAESVITMDDEIDRMNRIAHEELTRFIQSHPELAQPALQAIIISRNLERIADHATNIAMDVIFWVRGADLRHQLIAAID